LGSIPRRSPRIVASAISRPRQAQRQLKKVDLETAAEWISVRPPPKRERVLKVAARVLVHSRRATFVIGRSVAALWGALWRQLGEFAWEPEPGG
jgi:hypothetical protein